MTRFRRAEFSNRLFQVAAFHTSVLEAVEDSSPPSEDPCTVNPSSRTTRRSGSRRDGHRFPWDGSKWFQEAESGKEWRFTACGVYKTDSGSCSLERRFGRNPADFDGRADGGVCLFAIQITAEGRALLDIYLGVLPLERLVASKIPGPGAGWLDGGRSKGNSLIVCGRFAVETTRSVETKQPTRSPARKSAEAQSGRSAFRVQYAATRLNVFIARPQGSPWLSQLGLNPLKGD